MAFRDKGKIVLERFVVDTTNIAQVEKDVFMEGRVMSVVLSPKSDK
jgi:translation initiation factor IF-3